VVQSENIQKLQIAAMSGFNGFAVIAAVKFTLVL
jgi:hypothetical protein